MKKLLVSQRDLNKHVRKICTEIESSNWRPDYVVGLTRGGLIPAVMISEYFDLRCETLKISLRDGGECESNLWMAEDAFGSVPPEEQELYKSRWDTARRKNILIVDDINDSGATLNWIKEDWASGCFPDETIAWNSVWNNNVRVATLFDNAASTFDSVDYTANEINKLEKDLWIVFPWEKQFLDLSK